MCKYSFLIILFIFPVFSFANLQGSGTQSDPYRIYTKTDWDFLSDITNALGGSQWSRGKHFKLMNDIDDLLNKRIGHQSQHFEGHFNGNNKSIIVDVPNVFSHIGIDGVLENLNVNNDLTSQNLNAGIVGVNLGIVQYCINFSSISSPSMPVSGIVAFNFRRNGSIPLAGVYNCINYGNLTSNNASVSGIVSDNRSIVSGNINVGNLEVTSTGSAAGIILFNALAAPFEATLIEDTLLVKNNINIGSVIAPNAASGIVNFSSTNSTETVLFLNNINYGFIRGNNLAAGICSNPSSHSRQKFLGNFNSGVIMSNGIRGCIATRTGPNMIFINNHYDKQMCGDD